MRGAFGHRAPPRQRPTPVSYLRALLWPCMYYSPRQVSSMLGSTYAIPWPPFYESVLSTLAAVNIDVGQYGDGLTTQPMSFICRFP